MTASAVSEAVQMAERRMVSSATARRDAELLLMRAAGRDKAWLLTHGDAQLSSEQLERFEGWIARRMRQEPMQYILGETEFYGLPLRVTPDVLIPRPETEHLIEALLERVPREQALRICDVGTGSGAIAVVLAHALPRAEVTAVDISAAALAVAQENAVRHGVAERVRFLKSNLLEAVRCERFDAVVSNPPYVADTEVLEAQVAEYEPHTALYAGPTGLEVYQRLIPEALTVLLPHGWLVMEIGHGQRAALTGLLSAPSANCGLDGNPNAGWDQVEFVEDLQEIPRVAIARRRG